MMDSQVTVGHRQNSSGHLKQGLAHDLAQHIRQDAAVLVVIDLDRRIDAAPHRHINPLAIFARDTQDHILLWL